MPLIALVILLLDQLTKQFVLRVLALPMWWISDEVGLQLSMNSGVAFSFPLRGVLAILVTASITLLLVGYYVRYTSRDRWSALVFGLIIGGALGNLIDRVLYGAVVDFIRIYSYPSFNIADMAITIGFLLFFFSFDRITAKRFSLFGEDKPSLWPIIFLFLQKPESQTFSFGRWRVFSVAGLGVWCSG
ncbi:MAG: signal peptidase II [Candidatus Altimarinota bacterium]